MFSLEEDTSEDDHQELGVSLHDMCMAGFEDRIEAFEEEVASNAPSSKDASLGASPLLLSALTLVQAREFLPEALQQPPKAPLLKASPEPVQVPHFDFDFGDRVEAFEEDVASNAPSSNDVPVGASPMLLSALAQVQAREFPTKASLQPPKAPLLKSSSNPFEVPFFELPMSSASLADNLAPECECH
jgi:hypothetical protein